MAGRGAVSRRVIETGATPLQEAVVVLEAAGLEILAPQAALVIGAFRPPERAHQVGNGVAVALGFALTRILQIGTPTR